MFWFRFPLPPPIRHTGHRFAEPGFSPSSFHRRQQSNNAAAMRMFAVQIPSRAPSHPEPMRRRRQTQRNRRRPARRPEQIRQHAHPGAAGNLPAARPMQTQGTPQETRTGGEPPRATREPWARDRPKVGAKVVQVWPVRTPALRHCCRRRAPDRVSLKTERP